jgi:hypothetical protein
MINLDIFFLSILFLLKNVKEGIKWESSTMLVKKEKELNYKRKEEKSK